jgi:hypothetical protein
VDERIDLAEELDADLAQRRASVVPQGNSVSNRVWLRRLGVLERPGETQVRLRLSRDAMRVEPVGLALVAAALTQRRLVRRDLAHVSAGCDEELRERPAEPAGAFDAPPLDGTELGRPHQRSGVAVAVVGEVGVVEFAAALVEQGCGERLAVWVDADDVRCRHGDCLQVLRWWEEPCDTSQSR